MVECFSRRLKDPASSADGYLVCLVEENQLSPVRIPVALYEQTINNRRVPIVFLQPVRYKYRTG
jgi:hypothetical protein